MIEIPYSNIMIEIPYSDIMIEILFSDIMIEIPYSDIIKVGRNLGVPWLDFYEAMFFAGLFAGHFVGLSPAGFSPAKSPARGTELSNTSLSFFSSLSLSIDLTNVT